jgi:putative intracellular protease/amidase
VAFLRRATAAPHVVLGAICHGLWLWCAERDLIAGKKVTCSHNILCDVENAGGDVQYAGDGTADLVVDGNLVTGKHPEVNDKFMAAFADELDRRAGERAALSAGAGAGR